uniref:VWFA domain-containing protein n=1 Tax=Leptobrachium leishanense TaxID=445787 RepID=A0A8C5PL56_9ANUR
MLLSLSALVFASSSKMSASTTAAAASFSAASVSNAASMRDFSNFICISFSVKANFTFADSAFARAIATALLLTDLFEPLELAETWDLVSNSDIYLLIDGSGSIHYEEFKEMQNFLVDLVDVFDIGPQKVRFGAVQYSDTYLLEFQIGSDYSKTNLKLAIKNFRQLGGGTKTGQAMNYIRQLVLDPQNARAKNIPVYLIVLTDGESADSVKEAAEILRSHSVKLFAIGVKAANVAELLEITGDPKRVHFVKDFGALKDIKNLVARQIWSSKGNCMIISKSCHLYLKADVIFLVDSSGSIGDENYTKMKTFMKHLVNKTTVGRDSIQFGAVQFSDTTNLEFQLNSYSTASPIMDAIDRMTYMKATTYTGKALEFVSQYFTSANGARPNVKKILILITDGVAHDVVKTPAKSLRDSGVIIFSVGVLNANKHQLEEIRPSSPPVLFVKCCSMYCNPVYTVLIVQRCGICWRFINKE